MLWLQPPNCAVLGITSSAVPALPSPRAGTQPPKGHLAFCSWTTASERIPECSSCRRVLFFSCYKRRTSDIELLSANAEEWEKPMGHRVWGSLPARRRSLSVANFASLGEAWQWSEECSVLRKAGKLLTELTGSTKKLNLAVKVQYLG